MIDGVVANWDGWREALCINIGRSEAETSWSVFPRKLAWRGPRGVKRVVSDAYGGIKLRCRQGARWRLTARAHLMNSALGASLASAMSLAPIPGS